jgi:hypothetical protein
MEITKIEVHYVAKIYSPKLVKLIDIEWEWHGVKRMRKATIGLSKIVKDTIGQYGSSALNVVLERSFESEYLHILHNSKTLMRAKLNHPHEEIIEIDSYKWL